MKWISNKTLFNIHGWLGLNIGLFLFVICFSGTFAVFSNEVDWLLDEKKRIEHQEAPIRWEAMYQSLKAVYPGGTLQGIYRGFFDGHGDRFATVAYMALPNGQTRKVYLNHFTGEILRDAGFFNVQRFFRSYHRRFFDGSRGIFLVTLTSFFLLFSVLTGFLFYKGWLKNLFRLRLGKGIKALWSDVHKLTGIWSLLFALLIAVTGIFYFTEILMSSAGNYDALLPERPEPLGQEELAAYGANPRFLPLDEYVGNAQEVFPELDILTVRIPHQPGGYVYVDGRAGSIITRNRANAVYLHPYTGEVVHIQRDSRLNTAEFITDAADPLHFGYFGGLPTKILWFIFGLAVSFAILSGTYLWYVRGMEKMERKLKKKTSPNKQYKQNTPALAGFFIRHLTISRGAVLSAALILFYLISTGIGAMTEGIRANGPLPDERFEQIDSLSLGPWVLDIICEYPCRLEEGGVHGSFHETGGIPNYASLHLKAETEQGDTLTAPFSGTARRPSLAAGLGNGFRDSGIRSMQISIETQSGGMFSGSLPAERFEQARFRLNDRFEALPEKRYPDVPLNVYLFISFFGVCTIGIIGLWTWFLVRTTSRKLKLLSA